MRSMTKYCNRFGMRSMPCELGARSMATAAGIRLTSMNIDSFLDHLYRDRCRIDAAATSRADRMLNSTPSTGAFLDLLIRDLRPNRILELGTSNGYSTIGIGRAAGIVNATVDTVDVAFQKTVAAQSTRACRRHARFPKLLVARAWAAGFHASNRQGPNGRSKLRVGKGIFADPSAIRLLVPIRIQGDRMAARRFPPGRA